MANVRLIHFERFSSNVGVLTDNIEQCYPSKNVRDIKHFFTRRITYMCFNGYNCAIGIILHNIKAYASHNMHKRNNYAVLYFIHIS